MTVPPYFIKSKWHRLPVAEKKNPELRHYRRGRFFCTRPGSSPDGRARQPCDYADIRNGVDIN